MVPGIWGPPMPLGFWAKGPGTIVLILDIIKGIIPVTLLANAFGLGDALSLVIISVAAVAGHNWTVFLGFKGGKGMATSLGVLIGLAIQFQVLRIILLLVTLTWLVLFLLFGLCVPGFHSRGCCFSCFDGGFLEPFPIDHHVHCIVCFYRFSP